MTLEIILLIVILFTMGFTAIAVHQLQSNINEDIQADPDVTTEAKTIMQEHTTVFPQYMDNAILVFLIIFWIFILVSSYYIDTNPAFFIISVILLIFLLAAAVSITNTYDDLTKSDDYASFALDFPKTNYIMSHLVLICAVIGLTTGIVLYAKN